MIRKFFSFLAILLLPYCACIYSKDYYMEDCPGNTKCLYSGSSEYPNCRFWTYCCLTDPAKGPALCTASYVHMPKSSVNIGISYQGKSDSMSYCKIDQSDLDAQIQISKNFCSSYVAPGLPANIYFTHGFLAPYDDVFAINKDINGNDTVVGGTEGADTYNSQLFSS